MADRELIEFSELEVAHYLGEYGEISRGKGYEKAFGIQYFPYLFFNNVSELKKVIRNCPWTLSKSSLGEENRELGKQFQRQLMQGFVADVTIRWIDEEIGYGVFASREMAASEFVGEYTGEVRQLCRLHPDYNAYCFHYPTRFWSLNYYVIDAMKGGNEMRFINHSETPNLEPRCLVDRGILHIVFFTTKPIAKGEQLTFNYGPDFWRRRAISKSHFEIA